MGRSFDDIVANNQVAAETHAYRSLLEFRSIAGREREVRFGWTCGGQGGWAVIRAGTTLTATQRRRLHQLGWKFGRFNVGANYNGDWHRAYRGWSKSAAAPFAPEVTCTDDEAGEWFEARCEAEVEEL